MGSAIAQHQLSPAAKRRAIHVCDPSTQTSYLLPFMLCTAFYAKARHSKFVCTEDVLMVGLQHLSSSTLGLHMGDRFSSCLSTGREIEASETAEIAPRNSPDFFCTEKTVKRPETTFVAARTEELTAVGTIDAHQFPSILLPAPLW